ncbi:MAG: hypothetical protein ACFFG0_33090 [Candidatus Thorarchaeota archaeon]
MYRRTLIKWYDEGVVSLLNSFPQFFKLGLDRKSSSKMSFI